MESIMTLGSKFVDQLGRHRLFNGINCVCKDRAKGYIGDYTLEDFKNLSAWGFNLIRLGIIWNGVEPQPGKYDENYLDKIEELILLAKQYNMYVIIDMDQDLYSCEYADGAPLWAMLTDGEKHTVTHVWNETYIISEAVKTAFTNFWKNKEVDGKGLQDYYADAFKYVAQRVGKYENVMGFDLMNEPSPGSKTDEIIKALLSAYTKYVLKDSTLNIEEVAREIFGSQQGNQIVDRLQDIKVYKRIMKRAEGVVQKFDKKTLVPFYNKVASKLHKVAPKKIIFFENSYFSNMGMTSGVERLEDGMLQAYMPRGYDWVVDTDRYEKYSLERVEFIFGRHRQVQSRLKLPTLVGEWGELYSLSHTEPFVKHIIGIVESYQWSSCYWSFSENMNRFSAFKGLQRAYPQSTMGELRSYQYHYEEECFTCHYCPTGTGEITVYWPHSLDQSEFVVDIDCKYSIVCNKVEGYLGGLIVIRPKEEVEEILVRIKKVKDSKSLL